MPSAEQMQSIAGLGTFSLSLLGLLEWQEGYRIDGVDAPTQNPRAGAAGELRVMIGRDLALAGLLAFAFDVDPDEVVQSPFRLEASGEYFVVNRGPFALGLSGGVGWSSRSLFPPGDLAPITVTQINALGGAGVYLALAKWLAIQANGRIGYPLTVSATSDDLGGILPTASIVEAQGVFTRLQGGLTFIF
jgi:hypothetical protein